MKTVFKKLTLLGTSLLLILTLIPLPTSAATGCRDVDVLFARGSGENLSVTDPNAPGYAKIRHDLFSRLRVLFGGDPTLTVGYLDLAPGLEGTAHGYKAAGVSGGSGWERLVRLYNAAESSLNPDDRAYLGGYNGSVNEGKLQLIEYISRKAQQCPNTRYIVSGYSQGAHVVGNALNDSAMTAYLPKISYVALFGDPKLNIGTDANGNPTPTEDVAWFREGALLYDANRGGVLKPRHAYLPSALKYRSASWCLTGDAICSSIYKTPDYSKLLNNPPHEQYVSSPSQPLKSILFEIALQIRADVKDTHNKLIRPNLTNYNICAHSKQDIALLIDSRASMADPHFFSQTAANVRKIINTSCDTRVAIVRFETAQQPNIAVVSDFTRSPSAIANSILSTKSMYFNPNLEETGVRSAILKALNNTDWRADRPRSILVLTDSIGDGFPSSGSYLHEKQQALLQHPLSQQILSRTADLNGVTLHIAQVGSNRTGNLVTSQSAYYGSFIERMGGTPPQFINSPYWDNNYGLKIGCAGWGNQCYWHTGSLDNFVKQLTKKPQASAPTLISGHVGQPTMFKVTNITKGSFLNSGQANKIAWDTDCDGIFNFDGDLNRAEVLQTFSQPKDCKGKVRIGWYEGTPSYGFTFTTDYYFKLKITP